MVGIHHCSHARDLHDDLVERHLVIEGLGSAEHAVVADHAAFDRGTVLHLDDAGEDPGMRENNLLDATMTISQDLTVPELYNLKTGLHVVQIDRIDSSQDVVVRVGHSTLSYLAGGSVK